MAQRRRRRTTVVVRANPPPRHPWKDLLPFWLCCSANPDGQGPTAARPATAKPPPAVRWRRIRPYVLIRARRRRAESDAGLLSFPPFDRVHRPAGRRLRRHGVSLCSLPGSSSKTCARQWPADFSPNRRSRIGTLPATAPPGAETNGRWVDRSSAQTAQWWFLDPDGQL
jgi:hypothetical protein